MNFSIGEILPTPTRRKLQKGPPHLRGVLDVIPVGKITLLHGDNHSVNGSGIEPKESPAGHVMCTEVGTSIFITCVSEKLYTYTQIILQKSMVMSNTAGRRETVLIHLG